MSNHHQSPKGTVAGCEVTDAARYQLLFDMSPAGFLRQDEHGTVLDANEAICQLTGYARADIIGRKAEMFASPRDARLAEQHRKQVLAGGTYVHEVENLTRDGRQLYVKIVETCVTFPDGHKEILSNISDITRQRHTELLLQQQRQVFEMIASDKPLPEILEALCRSVEAQDSRLLASVLLFDAEHNRLRHGAAPSLPAKFIGAVDGIEIGPEVGSCGTAAFLKQPVIVSDIGSDPLWKRFTSLAAEHALCACWSVPVFGRQSEVLGTFAVYLRKPGKPSAAHLRLLESATQIATLAIVKKHESEKLRQANERTGFYMERMPLAFIAWDTNLCVTEWNPMAEKIFGWTAAEAIGRHAYELIVPPDVQPEVDKVRSELLTGRAGSVSVNDNITKDGRRLTCEWRNEPFRDAGGRVTGYHSLVEDISEQRLLEEQLRQSQKMEAVGKLAGGVAHDFNNILTIIQGNASLLQVPGFDPAQSTECVREILRATDRAAGLTRQLLLFSRKQTMQASSFDLNELVAQTAQLLRRILGEDIELCVDLAIQPGLVNADPVMVDQVIMNLAVNARDAMPQGGKLSVQTTLETLDDYSARSHPEARPGNYVCLSVSDDGVGIAPENVGRIFEPFFTTKTVGKGTGLGLATVYGIVQQHGGWISVDSKPGHGSTFRAYFPAVATSEPTSLREPSVPTTPVASGTETILVVEDEPPVRQLVAFILQKHGYTIHQAENGEAALDLWARHKHHISLVLSDVIMPGGINGHDLAKRLRQERPGLKIVHMSGYSADVNGLNETLHEGVNFIPKPFTPHRLIKIIRENLDRAD